MRELWALEEKIGKQPWKLCEFGVQFGASAEKFVKSLAASLSQQHYRRKYRAVKYTPHTQERESNAESQRKDKESRRKAVQLRTLF